jgi:fatty acid desaturase
MRTTATPGVSALAREAALDLGHLLGQHVKVAQLELKVELHAMGRRAYILAALAALLALGYALAMAGLAAAIAGYPAAALPLLVIGLAHVAGGGVGLVLVPLRKRGSQLMNDSSTAMARSLGALEEAAAPSAEKQHAA